eukprot:1158508-Pelagomonas_calceolata.AAC.22
MLFSAKCTMHMLAGHASTVLDMVGPALVAAAPLCAPQLQHAAPCPAVPAPRKAGAEAATATAAPTPGTVTAAGAAAAAAAYPSQPDPQQSGCHQQQMQEQRKQKQRVIPSAVSLAWLRTAAAALALMPPSLCGTHHTLIACVDAHCEAAVQATLTCPPAAPSVSAGAAATEAGAAAGEAEGGAPAAAASGLPAAGAAASMTASATVGASATTPASAAAAAAAAAAAGPPTDFQDPQRSVLLLEASRLWLGPAAMCHVCALIAAAPSPSTSQPHMNATAATAAIAATTATTDAHDSSRNGTSSSSSNQGSAARQAVDVLQATLLPRLQLCMASSAYEVRSACKALTHIWIGPLLERDADQPGATCWQE